MGSLNQVEFSVDLLARLASLFFFFLFLFFFVKLAELEELSFEAFRSLLHPTFVLLWVSQHGVDYPIGPSLLECDSERRGMCWHLVVTTAL